MRELFASDAVKGRDGTWLRLLSVAGLAACALLWTATSASAAPTWLAPANLSEAGSYAGTPEIAVDPQGDAVAVWRANEGTRRTVQAASREAGGAWSAPIDLSATGQEAEGAQVALDARGDAIAVWERYDGTNWIIQAASKEAGGSWSAPVNLSAAGQNGYEPQVAVDPQGDAVVAWQHYDGTHEIIQASSGEIGGAWSAPVDLSATGQEGSEPRIALDAQGNAIAVWQRNGGTDRIIQASSRAAGGSWSAPVDLSAAGQEGSEPRIAVDAQGDAVVAWQHYDGTNEIIQATSREAGGAWSAPVDLSAAGQSAYDPGVAIDARGDAITVWQRYDGTHQVAQTASREAGGAWSAPVDLSPAGQDGYHPQVAVDPQGDAVAVWEGSGSTNWFIKAASSSVLGAWSAPVDISAAGQDAESAVVALDAEGDAITVWERFDGTNWIVQAAAYDAAGPQLRNLTVPASGTAGQALSFSVSPLDAFSTLGATSWSFGDDATAGGTAVTHTYAKAGTYTVTVTSVDALGNASTATGTLTVTAPPSPAPASPVARPSRTALATAAARAQVRHGRALLRLTCPASGACTGQVVLSAKVKKAAKGHRAKKKARTRSVKIGAAPFTLAPGAHATIRVKLNAKGLALLKASGRRGLRAGLSGSGVKPGPLVLKAKPRRSPSHPDRRHGGAHRPTRS